MNIGEFLEYCKENGSPPAECISDVEIRAILVGNTKLMGIDGVTDSCVMLMLTECDCCDSVTAHAYYPSMDQVRMIHAALDCYLAEFDKGFNR